MDSDPRSRNEFRRSLDVVTPPAPWLQATVKEKLRQERRKRSWQLGPWRPVIVVRLPRFSQKVAAAVLLLVLAAAAVGVFMAAQRLVSHSVPAPADLQPPRGTIVFGRLNGGDEYLFKMHADGTGETELRNLGSGGGVRWSHNGNRLLWATPAPPPAQNLVTTATLRADGSGYTVLPLDSPGLNLGRGAWSPDDSRIAFAGFDDGDTSRNGIYTADATDGGNRLRVTTNREATRDLPVSYSPDGSKILFWRGPASSNGTGLGQLFVVGIDGSHQTHVSPPNMTVGFNDGDAGSWSPNGAQISFAATAFTSRSAVFVVAGDGTNPRQISAWSISTTSASWSPTGDWIVFDKYNLPAGPQILFLVRPDGSGTTAISPVGGVLRSSTTPCCTVWSPDGQRLLFSNGPDRTASDLWTVQVDGSHLTRLTHTPAYMWDVGWSAAT